MAAAFRWIAFARNNRSALAVRDRAGSSAPGPNAAILPSTIVTLRSAIEAPVPSITSPCARTIRGARERPAPQENDEVARSRLVSGGNVCFGAGALSARGARGMTNHVLDEGARGCRAVWYFAPPCGFWRWRLQ